MCTTLLAVSLTSSSPSPEAAAFALNACAMSVVSIEANFRELRRTVETANHLTSRVDAYKEAQVLGRFSLTHRLETCTV
jgi:hypothetical protein